MTLPFSILDLAQVVEGADAAQSFAASVKLAQKSEAMGYKRVWYAEHHNIAGVASSATSVLIAHIASQTKSIRIGSGGIMLPNHAPLLIAEQFGTLATLHPGRIDLGLGRAPGGDIGVIRALRKDYDKAGNDFPNDVQELIDYMAKPEGQTEVKSGRSVRAIPGEGTQVPVWILGSSLFGAQLAARLGLPYAFASHFAPSHLIQAAQVYRETFQPSAHLQKPYFMLACNVFTADTNDEADYHFSSLIQAFVGMLTNKRGLTPRPVKNVEVPTQIASHLEMMLQVSAVGSVETVARRLSALYELVKPDEVIMAKTFHDQEARLKSVELTMAARDLMDGV